MPIITFEEAAKKGIASKADIAAWAKAGLLHDGRDDDGNRTVDADELDGLVKILADGKGAPYEVLESDKRFDDATCIDLFAGAGGTALGFHNAGFHHTLLNEYDKHAVETLRLNNEALSLGWDEIDGRDVREIDFAGMKAEVIQAGFPCFPAGTPIITDKGKKPIEEIEPGDEVLTHKGRFRKVESVGAREHANTIALIGIGDFRIECTPNHPFLCSKRATFGALEEIMDEEDEIWTDACEMQGRKWLVMFEGGIDENGDIGKWMPVMEIRDGRKDVVVYNMEVEEDHSYTAYGVAVHNCQAFSTAGSRRGFEDTRGTMFFEFARAIRDIQPKIAIGENVKGLVQHDHGNTLKTMLAALDELGYEAEWRILRSHFLDVPQKRERIILFAVKRGSGCDIIFPKESRQLVTLRSALEGVPESDGLEYNDAKKKVMALVPEGGNWRDLPDDVARSYMGAAYGTDGGKTGMARRLAWNEPALTLTCHPAQKQTERCHPSEDRPLTVREYARVQCFPDEWEFAGTMLAQYKQIGNAVPVNLGYHVARCALASLGYIDFDPETMDKI